tara:strand:- start:4088 stop:4438 length:351 start_codon:yes stop_codon:yes gene_type:complete
MMKEQRNRNILSNLAHKDKIEAFFDMRAAEGDMKCRLVGPTGIQIAEGTGHNEDKAFEAAFQIINKPVETPKKKTAKRKSAKRDTSESKLEGSEAEASSDVSEATPVEEFEDIETF